MCHSFFTIKIVFRSFSYLISHNFINLCTLDNKKKTKNHLQSLKNSRFFEGREKSFELSSTDVTSRLSDQNKLRNNLSAVWLKALVLLLMLLDEEEKQKCAKITDFFRFHFRFSIMIIIFANVS